MKAKKTTLLSGLICIAGILAEIIFRDVLSKSFTGVCLSVLLAVVILVLVYFVYDGIYAYIEAKQELDAAHQAEREQKLYHVLNEQLQFEKAIIQEVNALKEASDKLSEKVTAHKQQSTGKEQSELLEQLTAQSQISEQILEKFTEQSQTREQLLEQMTKQSQVGDQLLEQMEEQRQVSELLLEQKNSVEQSAGNVTEQAVTQLDKEQFDQVVSAVNDHTMKAAKIIARYVNQNATELKALLQDNHKEEYVILKDLEGSQRTLLAIEEQKKQH